MAELVDETHGIQRAGVHLAFGVGDTPVFRFAQRIEREGKPASGTQVGEKNIAGIAEQEVADVQPLAKRPRDMKLHGVYSSKNADGQGTFPGQTAHTEGISRRAPARDRRRT